MDCHLSPRLGSGVDLIGITGAHQQQVAQVIHNLACELARIAAGIQGGMDPIQPRFRLLTQQRIDHIQHGLAGRRPQDVLGHL